MLITTNFQYGVLAGLLVYCVSVSMFSGDLDDNRILWLWAGIIMAVCRNAYLQSSRGALLNGYGQDAESLVPAMRSTRSIFVRPQAIKG
jgi:hypothetical protein